MTAVSKLIRKDCEKDIAWIYVISIQGGRAEGHCPTHYLGHKVVRYRYLLRNSAQYYNKGFDPLYEFDPDKMEFVPEQEIILEYWKSTLV